MTTATHLYYRGGSIPVTHATGTHLFFHTSGAERRVSHAAIRATGSVRLDGLDMAHLSPQPALVPTLAQLRGAAHAAYTAAKGRLA